MLGEVDVVFPVMHGPWGQDGTLQGLLEMAGVRYVGAGVLSSAVGTDKHFMKQLFLAAGLPVLPYVLVSPRQWERDPATIREAVQALGYPVFVKPARAGSSYGITRVDAPDDLDAAIEAAREFDPKVLVETAAVNAREVEIGVLQGLGRRRPRDQRDRGDHGQLRSTRSTTSRRSTSSRASRSRPRSTRTSPTQVHDLAVRAFEALDVEGLARVDFFVFGDGRVVRQRGGDHARLHRDLDVPAALAGVGPDLPRAGRAAGPARDGTKHRPALTPSDGRLGWTGVDRPRPQEQMPNCVRHTEQR